MGAPDDLAPGFKRVSGSRGPAEGKYRVQFRCGDVSRFTYEPHQLVWKHEGHDFDVVAVQRVE